MTKNSKKLHLLPENYTYLQLLKDKCNLYFIELYKLMPTLTVITVFFLKIGVYGLNFIKY